MMKNGLLKWRCAAGLLALALCSAPGQVSAQGDQEDKAEVVKDLSSRGTAKYRAEEYEEAIELYKQAYALEPVPNLLYNIARCYEKQKKYPEAIEYYEQFVVAPSVESEARQKALTRTENLREAIRAGDTINTKQDPEVVEKPVENPGTKKKGRGLAFVALGVGVGALGAGGAFGYLARTDEAAFNEATTPDERREARDRGMRRAYTADALFGAGALVTVGGVILLVRRSASSDTPSAAAAGEDALAGVSPWFGRDGGGVNMSWRF